MSSTYSQNGIELQGAGDNLNTWGDPKLNNALKRLNYLVSGFQSITVNGDVTLTSSNTSTSQADFQAYNGLIKLVTGTATSGFNVTVPSLAMKWTFWNATAYTATITTGAGATVSVDSDDIVEVFCDGSVVKTLGYDSLSLKAYIAAAVLAATGSLPSTTGNADKVITTDGSSAFWDYVGNANMDTMLANTIKGRLSSTGTPQDLTATQATTILNAVVGDSGSGGTKGLVPAPAAGDAAIPKFLKADGTWALSAPWTQIATGTATGASASITFTGISANYSDLLVVISGLSHDSGGSPRYQIAVGRTTLATALDFTSTTAASDTIYGALQIPRYLSSAGVINGSAGIANSDLTMVAGSGNLVPIAWRVASGIERLSVSVASGNLDAGTVTLYGR